MVKKVLFVSFLTFALCFSLPSDPQASQPPVAAPSAVKNAEPEQHFVTKETLTKPVMGKNDSASTEMAPNNKTENPNESPKSPQTVKVPGDITNNTAVPITNITAVPTANVTVALTSNATEVTGTNKTVVPSTGTNKTTDLPPKHDTTTIAPATTVAPVTTEKTTNSTTEIAAATTSVTKIVQARGFDGASFIGGMILTLGLLAFGFVGLKYYRSKTEQNYHTL